MQPGLCLTWSESQKAGFLVMQPWVKPIPEDLEIKDKFKYEGDSICNEIALITPSTHGLELHTIYGMKDQGFTNRMVHKTLFYHSYVSSYRR